jgi:hypothetical protein
MIEQNYAIAISGLIKMVNDKTYYCNYPEDLFIDNIKTAIIIDIPEIETKEKLLNGEYLISYTISRYCDIFHDITIKNCNLIEMFIEIGGKSVFYYKPQNNNDISIKPFEFGIPMVALGYHSVRLFIKTDKENPTILFNGLLLDKENRRKVAINKLIFGDIEIYNGKWYSKECKNFFQEECLKYENNETKYIYNYPQDPNVNNIIAKDSVKRELYKFDSINNTYNYTISGNFDIIKEFLVLEHIDIFTLYIGNEIVFCSNKCGLIIQPFKFGIPLKKLLFHEVKIEIKSKVPPILYTKGFLLKKEDSCILENNSIEFTEEKRHGFKNGMYGKL